MSKLSIKKNDTFLVACTYSDSQDVPQNLTSVDIKSQIRTISDTLVCELVVVKADQTTNVGQYMLRQPVGFSFEVGSYLWDIQYTTSGVVTSTETIELQVENDITK